MEDNEVYIAALWLNKKGSVTALCQERKKNQSFIGRTTHPDKIIKSCLHPFSIEKCEKLLNIETSQLQNTNKKNPMIVEISLNTVFRRKLRIQTLEALGVKNALSLGILNGSDETEKYYRKRNKITNEYEIYNGEYIYRKTRVAPVDFYDVKINYESLSTNSWNFKDLDSKSDNQKEIDFDFF